MMSSDTMHGFVSHGCYWDRFVGAHLPNRPVGPWTAEDGRAAEDLHDG